MILGNEHQMRGRNTVQPIVVNVGARHWVHASGQQELLQRSPPLPLTGAPKTQASARRPSWLTRAGTPRGGGDNPVTCHLTISGEKGRLAFERMDKLYLEQTEDAFCQEADVEITIF